ncbi:hypothetical protein KP509_29G053500 [Ceratopteris richardii]|uniref:E3 ubiquitin-protein ligase n=2 Tax=Ceratopteris richardii TaxID=49495 RepID=A0A8T2R732_CERRI|nr:hypothetical protein KP509_29G053500 [Ceratopteris richardii]
MEADEYSASSPSESPQTPPSPLASITHTSILIERLQRVGVPEGYLENLENGLLQFVKENKGLLQDIVRALMPSTEDVRSQGETEESIAWHAYKEGCKVGVRWAQWLMLGGDPKVIMKELQQETGNARGVCGAVWGSGDLAYRCRTCENDPTCAVCVPCFEPSKHINHDYSMIHTGGGCCDCGDVTAWNESGFCSKHSGIVQAPCLPEDIRPCFELVMEALLGEWGSRLRAAASFSDEEQINNIKVALATQTSLPMIGMLLSFCNCSESLLACSADLIASEKLGLVDLFLKCEHFLPTEVVNRLNELLYKLMGEPHFKRKFAEAFVHHYPQFVEDELREITESTNGYTIRESAALNNFSVQIFTVPTLTPHLVVDFKLLDMLLDILKKAFISCSKGDPQLLADSRQAVAHLCMRIINDIRFIMRHNEVADYVARERPELLKAWIHLLAFTQGMDSQKRQTNIHTEEESSSWITAYMLEVSIAEIHGMFIAATAKMDSPPCKEASFSDRNVDEDVEHAHAKIGRTSAESDVSGKMGASNIIVTVHADKGATSVMSQGFTSCAGRDELTNVLPLSPTVPNLLLWLISECSKVLVAWFSIDEYRKSSRTSRPNLQQGGWPVYQNNQHPSRNGGRFASRSDGPAFDQAEYEAEHMGLPQEGSFKEWLQPNNKDSYIEWWMGPTVPALGVSIDLFQNKKEWLEIEFDVSQQEVSFHIPLHRYLAVALKKAMEVNPNLNNREGNKRSWHHQDHLINEKGFLLQLLPACYQSPAFVSCLMEHPLRIQVWCAQIWAGMWRRNGHSVQALCEHYNSVKWCETSSDLDLFLFQCCGVMAPTEEFVDRIISRFGLHEYFSMLFHLPKEYETTLAKHMLTLLIQIVAERQLSGFSVSRSCRRELIKRLATSDATHSQLMKALPHSIRDDNQWQDVLHSVSTYYQPSGMRQGRFSLRQECWNEFDLYHPRWNARALQSAEERYFHACKVSPIIKQVPQWQSPFAPFESLSRIATCKKVLDMLRSTFCHALFSTNLSESCAPEDVLITALHLLALALDICSLSACRKSLDYKVSTSHCETPNSDSQELPPLLANATEYVLFKGVEYPGISNRQSLISMLVLLMQRYIGDKGSLEAAGEPQSCNIGVLIKNLLVKFSNLHKGCMQEIKSLAPEIVERMLPSKGDVSKENIRLEQSNLAEADKKKLLARERQAAIMAKMRAAQERFIATYQPSQEQDGLDKGQSEKSIAKVQFQSQDEQSIQTAAAVMCTLCRDPTSSSPTSFLAFVQRSKLLEINQRGIPSWEKREKLVDAEMPDFVERDENETSFVNAEEQERIRVEVLNLLQRALNGEVDQEGPVEVEALMAFLGNEGFNESFEDNQSSLETRMAETETFDSESDGSAEEDNALERKETIDVPVDRSPLYSPLKGAMIEGEDEKAKTRKSFLITVLLEYASVLSRKHKENYQLQSDDSASSQRESGPRLVDRNSTLGLPQDRVGSNDYIGIHMSSCGHAVHQECLDRYRSSLLHRYQTRTFFEGLQIVDPDQRELLCPVCRRLANTVLPCIPETSVPDAILEEQDISVSCIDICPRSSSARLNLVPNALSLLHNSEELVWKAGFRKAVAKPLPRGLKAALDSLFWKLFSLHFPGRGKRHRKNCNRVSQSLLLWNVLRYTILSAELSSRHQEAALDSEHTLGALLQHADKRSILPVLLRAAKAVQNQNRQSVLLRARGMQLLVGAVCLGVSEDSLTESLIPGSVSKLLHLIENGKQVADSYFWRRTADPILAHDPFSSLLWIMYCLPLSVVSYREPFVSLVQVLYLVCVYQIMASMGNFVLSNLSEMQIASSTCSFLSTIIGNLTSVDVFSYTNNTTETVPGSLTITLRRFTLPYLRQCALLGKLCCNLEISNNSSGGEVDSDALQMKNVYSNISDLCKDLTELDILEKAFSLPSLQMVLEDKINQEIVLMWCNHICEVFGQRNLLPIPRPRLAAPFKLMDLPPLYQTLLQFYIKERCPVCSKVPEQPALCLLCGTLCCGLSRSACCSINSQSECFRHAVACNGGVAVFLMIKKTNILLQRFNRRAFWPSPYLDDFGEEDVDMHRGKPLHLNVERYAALTRMVSSHGLDQSSSVLSDTTWETFLWGNI